MANPFKLSETISSTISKGDSFLIPVNQTAEGYWTSRRSSCR